MPALVHFRTDRSDQSLLLASELVGFEEVFLHVFDLVDSRDDDAGIDLKILCR